MGKSLDRLTQKMPILSALHNRASILLRAKPVFHLSAAILMVGFLPLFPPLIFSLIREPPAEDHRVPLTRLGKLQEDCSLESSAAARLCEQRSNMDQMCALQGYRLVGEDRVPVGPSTNCAESMLALGYRLNLTTVKRADLELIPGISSKLSGALITNRKQILKEAATKDEGQRHEAFQLVKGIGKRISLRLSEFIGVDYSPIQ